MRDGGKVGGLKRGRGGVEVSWCHKKRGGFPFGKFVGRVGGWRGGKGGGGGGGGGGDV